MCKLSWDVLTNLSVRLLDMKPENPVKEQGKYLNLGYLVTKNMKASWLSLGQYADQDDWRDKGGMTGESKYENPCVEKKSLKTQQDKNGMRTRAPERIPNTRSWAFQGFGYQEI